MKFSTLQALALKVSCHAISGPYEGDAVLVIKIGVSEERTNVTLKNSNAADGTVSYTECQ